MMVSSKHTKHVTIYQENFIVSFSNCFYEVKVKETVFKQEDGCNFYDKDASYSVSNNSSYFKVLVFS